MLDRAEKNCCCRLPGPPLPPPPPPPTPPPPTPPTTQPLVPSRDQEQATGLPKPLQRWRDAEPLLEGDPRFEGLRDEQRWVSRVRGGGPARRLVWLGSSAGCAAQSTSWLHIHWTEHRSQPAATAPLATRRERMWRRYVEDALFNRDHPHARPRTQRRQRRSQAEEEEGAAGGARRTRLPPALDEGGMDRAYRRAFLEGDAKRQRRD